MINIGIDTGGTCTDAVVYDTEKHEVLSWSKKLTTKRDLRVGILEALRGLDPEQTAKAECIALSTTLATNACVENKGGRARLIFIGVNPKAVSRMSGDYGLPAVEDIYFMDGDPKRFMESEEKPDWEDFEADIESFRDCDSIAIVQINPRYNDGEYEREAERILRKHFDVTCVRGYELYQELNVQKRGATALLNARLIPIMKGFFESIEASIRDMGIDLPIVVVKSNGNIMNRDYAEARPVDTLLCGPAASVMGALELTGRKNGIVIDIGGTTSDVAVVKNGVPLTDKTGITVGKWNTMVDGISIDTFGLGGDTAVKYHNGLLYLDQRRQIPLCVLAAEFPQVKERLARVVKRKAAYGYPAMEFFVLTMEPSDMERYTEKEQLVIRRLKKGPLIYDEIAELIGVSPYIFSMNRLENEGIIIRSGVTPTDVMHIKGDFCRYDKEASSLGVEYLTFATGLSAEQVCDTVYRLARMRLNSSLVKILYKRETGKQLTEEQSGVLEDMAADAYKNMESHLQPAYIHMDMTAGDPILGIGGPSRVLIDNVAAALNTTACYPQYREIANAIGATVGRLTASHSIRIEPDMNRNWGHSYYIIGGGDIIGLNDYEQALKRARAMAVARAEEKLRHEGAAGEIRVTVDCDEEFYNVVERREPIFVQTVVTAKADADFVINQC
jgi:N-methylhydantoinase A/oxoprolinase/acetone carboxylase beta subunit